MTALTLVGNHDVAAAWVLVAIACLICAATITHAIRENKGRR